MRANPIEVAAVYNGTSEAGEAGSGSSRLRVLHLLHSFESGGTERQAVELLKRLDPVRYDVRLAALRRHGPLYAQIEHRFPTVPEFPLTSFYDRNAVRQLRRLCALLKVERIDILHTHDFYAGMLGVVAARLTGIIAITGQRNMRQSDRLAHKWGQRFIVRMAHRVMGNSKAIRDQIIHARTAPPQKLVVIPNGLATWEPVEDEATIRTNRRIRHDALCRELGIETNAKLIGIVANLRPVKGHRYLIEAAPRILQHHPAAHFVLVGDGELREELKKLVMRLGLGSHVHWLGWRADASNLTAAFTLSVLTSLHEGLPNSVMEAMAAGTPVLATAVGGVGELIRDGETGFLASAADAKALASRICRVLANEDESLNIGMRGRSFVMSQFTMQRMVSDVQDLYDHLVPDARRSVHVTLNL